MTKDTRTWEKEFDDIFTGWENTKFDMSTGEIQYEQSKKVDSIVVSKQKVKALISSLLDQTRKEEKERIVNSLKHNIKYNILLISENGEEPCEVWVLEKIHKIIDSL